MVSPMNSMLVICILGFSLLLKVVVADVFTAVIKMECLVKVEKKMLNALDVYIEESQRAREVVPESVVPFLSMARSMNEDAHQPHFIENPINAFHFMRRMASDWNRVISDINCDECIETPASKHLNISLTAIKKGTAGNYAGEVDQMGTALALVRLWHTYRLDLAALFRGEIYNTKTYPLSADDVYYICRLLHERQSYYKEILWLDEFTKQIDNGCYKGKTTPARAYKALAGAYFAFGMPWKSEDILAQYLINDPDNKSVKRDMRFYGERTKAIPPQDRIGVIETSEIDIQKSHYEALCRGDVVRPINVTSKLKCFMKPTVNPLLFAKEEVLNYDPRVSMYYDVITEKEELFIKDMVMNKFERSGITGNASITGRFEYGSEIRISQTAWLHDTLSPIIDKFTSRIQVLTGLSTQLFHSLSHAEELQVLNYGIGGMYEPHVDWFGFPLHEFRNATMIDPPYLMGSGDRLATFLAYGYPIKTLGVRPADPPMLKGTGDRLATWLTYLNSVEAGGSTVFTDLDITVPVVKRAAAFWYNVKRTGECDVRTTHAGCPVLIGSKWAANKWIRETGNLFRRRCGSTPSSLDEPLS